MQQNRIFNLTHSRLFLQVFFVVNKHLTKKPRITFGGILRLYKNNCPFYAKVLIFYCADALNISTVYTIFYIIKTVE